MAVLVLGYGNPLRGDDGVGWVAAERLQGAAGITAAPLHQLLPEHADLIQTAAHVIFVDATVVGEPGAVRVQALAPAPYGLAASHQMSPGLLLAMARTLYGCCPPAHLITITGQDFGYAETLSPPVQLSVERVIHFLLGAGRSSNRLFYPIPFSGNRFDDGGDGPNKQDDQPDDGNDRQNNGCQGVRNAHQKTRHEAMQQADDETAQQGS